MGRTVGIPFKGDGRHSDDRACGKPLFQSVIFRLTFRQTETPAVVMDDDGDVIRVVDSDVGRDCRDAFLGLAKT